MLAAWSGRASLWNGSFWLEAAAHTRLDGDGDVKASWTRTEAAAAARSDLDVDYPIFGTAPRLRRELSWTRKWLEAAAQAAIPDIDVDYTSLSTAHSLWREAGGLGEPGAPRIVSAHLPPAGGGAAVLESAPFMTPLSSPHPQLPTPPPLMTSRRLMVRWFRPMALPWYRLARWYRRSPTRSQGWERATTQPPGGSASQAYQPPVARPATGPPPMEIVASIGGEASPAQPAGSCASQTMVGSSGGAAGPETFWMRPSQAYSPISRPISPHLLPQLRLRSISQQKPSIARSSSSCDT